MKSNVGSLARSLALGVSGLLASGMAMAAGVEGPSVAGIPVDFILFALTLLGVALFHDHTLKVGLVGLAAVIVGIGVLIANNRFGARTADGSAVLAQRLLEPTQLPVGVMTGIMGAPYLLWLLVKETEAGEL